MRLTLEMEDPEAMDLFRLLFGRAAREQQQAETLALLKLMAARQMELLRLMRDLSQRMDMMSETTIANEADFEAEISGFRTDLQNQTTVVNSAMVFVHGLADQLAKALAGAAAAGAPTLSLAPIKELHNTLLANTSALADAIKANTVAQNEPSAPVEPTTTAPTVDPSQPDVPAEGSASAGVTGGTEGSAEIS